MASASDAPSPSVLDRVDGRLFDVVIIGGGISGASAAQHLSAAGYSVLLAERNDFASAATARSSRLLHNGLRYLAPPRSVRLWAALSHYRRQSGGARGIRTGFASKS